MSKQQVAQRHASQQCMLTATTAAQPLEIVHLSLHETDPVTGDEDGLSALFYEYYRGYTIYSNVAGICCIHGSCGQGCLRLEGKYVSFPDIEEAKTLIKRFRAEEYTSYDSMERYLPAWEYVCLNRREQQRTLPSLRPMQQVSQAQE
jgi:hypothetical protein